MCDRKTNRRDFCRAAAGLAAAGCLPATCRGKDDSFRLKYIVASSLYGRMKLDDVLGEVRKTGAEYIDIWPERHANHREQIEAMGRQEFAAMLKRHRVKLGMLTRYDLGPFKLTDEMQSGKELGASVIICGSKGPRNLRGQALKTAVRDFIEAMKPHLAVAEPLGITIGIENHANSLINSADSIRWFGELTPSPGLGIALAPYHFPQDPKLIAGLIADLDRRLVHFYGWQHGAGCMEKLPKEQELLQMPGRGKLDFIPIVAGLKKINYNGWTEIFMHPVPRGIPILPTAREVTAEINRSRLYLENCLKKIN
ncbi:MAG: sugar phosphate isomerase/epimerase [Planctomycetes bacterium]|nr:sugar phosphate isomerase/epimerase [Planctomycetota bacterium]